MPWRAIKAAKRERVADAGYIISRNVISTLHHMTYFLSIPWKSYRTHIM